MGPWAHQLPFNQPTSGGTGDIDFGPEAAISLVDIERRWFDHFLKAEGADLPCSPVRIFVMGENRWRDEQQWPLARTDYTSYYLHSGGSANTLNGDGILSAKAPGDEPADHYRYDPDNPVPTAGGRFVGGGVADQRKNQSRADVLVYTGPELAEDVEITGPCTVHLHAMTTAADTDFVAVLSDVRPDGYAQNLAEGIVRGRFRESLEPSIAAAARHSLRVHDPALERQPRATRRSPDPATHHFQRLPTLGPQPWHRRPDRYRYHPADGRPDRAA